MFGSTTFELARIQFGFTISFHIIFPAKRKRAILRKKGEVP